MTPDDNVYWRKRCEELTYRIAVLQGAFNRVSKERDGIFGLSWIIFLALLFTTGGWYNSVQSQKADADLDVDSSYPVSAYRDEGGFLEPNWDEVFDDESISEPEPIVETHEATLHYRITCYGPPTFSNDSVTASGLTVGNALAKAESLGLDGICAVTPDTPWYATAKDAETGIHVAGFGFYLVCDRTAGYARGTIDIWNSDLPAVTWMERDVEVYELDRGNNGQIP